MKKGVGWFIAAPGSDAGAIDAGAFYVFWGPSTGVHELGLADVKVQGTVEGDQAGSMADLLETIDKDNQDDVLIGGPLLNEGAGGAYLFRGLLGFGE